MTEQLPTEVDADRPVQPSLKVVTAAALVLGAVADLFCLLLLPVRLGGHLVPAAPALVFVTNAVLATAATRLARDRLPAQLLVGLAILLAAAAVSRGPGGDLLVTRDLEGMFLGFVIAACLGAAAPLLRPGNRARSTPTNSA